MTVLFIRIKSSYGKTVFENNHKQITVIEMCFIMYQIFK